MEPGGFSGGDSKRKTDMGSIPSGKIMCVIRKNRDFFFKKGERMARGFFFLSFAFCVCVCVVRRRLINEVTLKTPGVGTDSVL